MGFIPYGVPATWITLPTHDRPTLQGSCPIDTPTRAKPSPQGAFPTWLLHKDCPRATARVQVGLWGGLILICPQLRPPPQELALHSRCSRTRRRPPATPGCHIPARAPRGTLCGGKGPPSPARGSLESAPRAWAFRLGHPNMHLWGPAAAAEI